MTNASIAKRVFGGLLILGVFLSVRGSEPKTALIPMRDNGASAFYVEVHIDGFGSREFLVDTGAGYMTIDEDTLAVLRTKDRATYVRELEGILADGSRLRVPVYRLTSIKIGNTCILRDVEAAVFPGTTRGLLGLSALRRTAPFLFSLEPPVLQLSNCFATSA
ncbi:MAG: retroviral-like aspartic protease family protein [Gammaproteobacteria bacterium]